MTTLDSILARYDQPSWGLAFWRGRQPNGKISLRETGLEVTGKQTNAPFVRDATALADEDFAALCDRMSTDAAKAYLYNKYPALFDRWDRAETIFAGVQWVKARNGKIDPIELGVFDAPSKATLEDVVRPFVQDAAKTLEKRELPLLDRILHSVIDDGPVGVGIMYAIAAGQELASMQRGNPDLASPPLPPRRSGG